VLGLVHFPTMHPSLWSCAHQVSAAVSISPVQWVSELTGRAGWAWLCGVVSRTKCGVSGDLVALECPCGKGSPGYPTAAPLLVACDQETSTHEVASVGKDE
jgi:hypothetical protein